jgi:hypothetical protein
MDEREHKNALNSLWNFISADYETRLARSGKLNDFIDGGMDYFLGPTGIPNKARAANTMMNPIAQMGQAGADAVMASDPRFSRDERINYGVNALTGSLATLAPAAFMKAAGRPAADAVMETLVNTSRPLAVDGISDAARRFAVSEDGSFPAARADPTLSDALARRAEEMKLAPKDRTQAIPGQTFLDTDYLTPPPSQVSEALPDLRARYPRNPDPSAPLPVKDRARVLVDRRDEIGTALADRIKATGQMDADTRYFYNSDGPLYRGAIRSGLSPEEAGKYIADLGDNVAATSPRTVVSQNMQNATMVMAKENQGIPFRNIVGQGTPSGMNEVGYPMMLSPGGNGRPAGIHGSLLDQIAEGGLNSNTNPKPSIFGPNMAGNRSGVTVDTHAIRGTLQTLNELEPGSVPDNFILPKYRDAYAADPSALTPNMIDDSLGSQKVDGVSMQTEYSTFADIWHDAADKLGVSPAEAQSMGWFGFGDQTNLGSARQTPVDLFNERLSVTAQNLDIPIEEAARLVYRRQIPLMAVPLAAGASLGLQGEDPYGQGNALSNAPPPAFGNALNGYTPPLPRNALQRGF